MTGHRKAAPGGEGFPSWLTNTVVLVVLALLAYTVIVVGEEGYPVSMMLGGLLGAYRGADELLKRRNGADGGGDPPTGAA